MTSHEKAISIAKDYKGRDLNEADTRHQIIDPIIHEVLGWPRSRVKCEEYINPGFADYVLYRRDDAPILFVEAKKEGDYFALPDAILSASLSGYVKVKTLLTDPRISNAITQVRQYCLDVGCDVAAITNGHEWIFFKTYQKEEDWRSLNAFVVKSLAYFAERFIEACNHLSYAAITEKGSLRRLLLDSAIHNRELYYPKLKINSFDAPVDANQYASTLRPIADNFFGVIDVEDHDFMDNCYVSDREYDISFTNARRRLEDAITPYLEQYNIQNFRDTNEGGGFGKRLTKNIVATKTSDVVVLFGGKGVGKSTFLRKLLFHKPPQILRKNAIVSLIDLLPTTPDSSHVLKAIWEQLVECLDLDQILKADRERLCLLFQDRYEEAKRQDLYGIEPTSESYNVRLNELVRNWKSDLPYVATKLASYWRSKHKTVIVVIDNTDQYKEELQEICFAAAQEISSKLSCLVVVSMREEKFYSSSIHGVLDAFQNSGFHITSPEPRQVFIRRIDYLNKLLLQHKENPSSLLPRQLDEEVMIKLLKLFRREFEVSNSHLANFLTACSHGNIRLALELFRGFLVSGYTNIFEMTSTDYWRLQSHQVVKPFMIPIRFFYDESKSKIPNIFQIRSKSNGSHFTALRILSKLSAGQDLRNPAFTPVAKLINDFIEIYGMREDFEMNMEVLLNHALIESNNRLEHFDDHIDSVKVTAYGEYILRVLSTSFNYLDLISTDCAIADQQTSNTLTTFANDDYSLYVKYEKMERIKLRINKTELFLSYLEKEEAREIDLFKTHDYPTFASKIKESFAQEKVRILKSAKRNVADS